MPFDFRGPCELAQLLAVGVFRDRNMQIVRGRQPQQLLQVNVAWRGIQQVDSPHDLRDSLLMVIGNDRQLVGDKAVATFDHEVPGFGFEPLALFALQCIDEMDQFVVRAHANRYVLGAAAAAAGSRVDRPQWATPGAGEVAA